MTVTRVTMPTANLRAEVRIVVVADLHTDALELYEERGIRRASAEEPDLFPLAPDYLHAAAQDRYAAMSERLNAMLREEGKP